MSIRLPGGNRMINESYENFQKNLDDLAIGAAERAQVERFADRNRTRMDELAQRAYAGELPDYPICRLKPLSRLAVLIWKLTEIRRKYLSMGVSEEVFRATIDDISLRQRLFLERAGKPGLTIHDCIWFRHIINAEIFRLGCLQFQKFAMIYPETKGDGSPWLRFSAEQKEGLPEGSPVVNVHIQQGADLAAERVKEAFGLAREFFAARFPEVRFEAFVCYSWLLYPGLRRLLPEGSKILAFAENFEIIGVSTDREQAIERVFGKRFRNKRDYPCHTALQRAALREMGQLGFACGVVGWQPDPSRGAD